MVDPIRALIHGNAFIPWAVCRHLQQLTHLPLLCLPTQRPPIAQMGGLRRARREQVLRSAHSTMLPRMEYFRDSTFPLQRSYKSKAETEAESKANAIRWLSWKFLFLISSAREIEKEYALNSKNYRDQKYRRKTLGPKSREDKSSEGGWYEVLGTTEVFQIWTQVGIFSWEKTHTYMLSTQF